jgi:hypothetical protein
MARPYPRTAGDTVRPVSGYTVVRAADVPDYTGGDEEATLLMLSVRVEDHAAESQGHDGFWPAE